MNEMIKLYIERLTSDDINNFAMKNDVYLNEKELIFTYNFVKKNAMDLIKNPDMLDLEEYRNYYSSENFLKIEKLLKEYLTKFKNYL